MSFEEEEEGKVLGFNAAVSSAKSLFALPPEAPAPQFTRTRNDDALIQPFPFLPSGGQRRGVCPPAPRRRSFNFLLKSSREK